MRVLSGEELTERAAALGVPWESGDDASWRDALRAQVAAEGVVLRRALVDRTLRAHGGDAAGELREKLVALLEELDSVGDVFAGAGGLVAAAPPRAALVRGTRVALLLGSAPTSAWRAVLPGEVIEPRRIRRVRLDRHDEAALARAVESLGGAVSDERSWSGLDRAPATLDAWWQALARRTPDAEPSPSASDEPEETYVLRDGRGRYRARSPSGGALGALGTDGGAETQPWLGRTRQPGGWFRYAWHRADGDVELTRDEAARTALALDARGGVEHRIETRTSSAGGVEFELPVLIPRAEYRSLLALSDSARAEANTRRATYAVSRDVWIAVRETLVTRLGLRFDEPERDDEAHEDAAPRADAQGRTRKESP